MTRSSRLVLLSVAVSSLLGAPSAAGEDERDWPRWRGVHADDTAHVTGVFDKPFELRLRWRRALGSGYAGVVVRGDTAVTLASSAGEDFVVALEAASGAERWRHSLGPTFVGLDGAVDGPAGTPTLSADTVYAFAPRGELVALALSNGAPRWSKDLAREFSAPRPHWGFTAAPLLVGELVVVACGGEGHAFVALAQKDGALRWAAGSDTIRYQSPILSELDGRELVLGAGNSFLFGLEPKNGEELLRVPHGGLDFYQEILQPLALGEDRFLLKNQRLSSRCVRLAPGMKQPAELWTSRHLRQNYNQSVLHDGLLYGHGGAFLSCVDAETGELVWRSREPGDGWEILVDGELVILTKDGGLFVAPASPDGYQPRASLALFEHLVWTPPSFARGCIFARDSLGDVACVELVPAAAAPVARAAPSAPGTLLNELVARAAAAAEPQAVVDEFLARQTSFPVIEGERTAHFLFRGPARDVAVKGDPFDDVAQRPLTRLAGTDLFYTSVELAPDARVGYQFVRDLDEVLADPLNPRATASLTLAGPVSALLMPRAEALPEPEVVSSAGTRESFVLDVPVQKVDGRAWGGPRRVWVHLPPGYAAGAERYPVLYVNDGENAQEVMELPALFDGLAGRGAAPLIAVFVELQSAYELARSEQESYRDLLVERVVPYVDAHYRTQPAAAARATLGWDEGAYAALFAALTRPAVFGVAVAQSLYHGSNQGDAVLTRLVAEAETLPFVLLAFGRYDSRDPRDGHDTVRSSRALAAALAKRGARVEVRESADGDQCAFWRARLPGLLSALFPPGGRAER